MVVVGAGAAGCFAALAARGAVDRAGRHLAPPPDAPSVLLVDGQQRPGRKILVSGGGRCNVTNEQVRVEDFVTRSPRALRSLLHELPVSAVQRFFADAGVPLAVEPMGKLFPADGRRARDVVAALDTALARAGVVTRYGTPVTDVHADGDGWVVDGVAARRVVLATGGRSVPATGSTGFGLDLAARLGHELVPPVPALAALHAATPLAGLAGLTVPAIVTVADPDGRVLRRAAGSLLLTHRGASGPAALDVSELVERHGGVRVTADLWSLQDPDGPMGAHLDAPKLPGACLPDPPAPIDLGALDATLAQMLAAAGGGNATLGSVLRTRLPRRLVEVVAGEHAATPAARVGRAVRREVAATLCRLDLRVVSTAGYAKAEVTAGGVSLDDLDRRTLESRVAPGLHLCGEVCDVTGRLGGFNFQWAWTSGLVAGRAAGAATAGGA